MVARNMTILIGGGVWIGAALLLSAPIAAKILLGAPLLLVPLLLADVPDRPAAGPISTRRMSGLPAVAAALPLVAAYMLPPGPAAAFLTLLWLLLTALCLAAGVRHGMPRLPGILHPRHAAELGVDGAFAALAVGAAFLTIDRLGARPLDLSTEIVLLTAVHFHFTGFVLLSLASLAAAGAGGRPARAAVLALVVGIAVTATGFNLHSDLINAVGAVIVAGGAVLMGVVLLRAVATGRTLRGASLALSGLGLLVGPPMGALWAISIVAGWAFLDLETMVRTHGALNAAALVVATLAWPQDERS